MLVSVFIIACCMSRLSLFQLVLGSYFENVADHDDIPCIKSRHTWVHDKQGVAISS